MAVLPPPTTTTRPSCAASPAAASFICSIHAVAPTTPGPSSPGIPSLRVRAQAQAEEDGVVLGEQLRRRARPCRPRRPSAARRPSDATHSTSCERVVGVQLVRRDAGRVEPARQRALLEDRRVVPLEREVRRARERRGPGADAARRCLPASRGLRREERPRCACARRRLRRVALQPPDRDRRRGASRCRRTRPRRAPRPGRRARTSSPRMFCSKMVRAAPRTLPRRDLLDEVGTSIVGRARLDARRVDAVEAALGLGARLGLGVERLVVAGGALSARARRAARHACRG